jgi:hypothetical protein
MLEEATSAWARLLMELIARGPQCERFVRLIKGYGDGDLAKGIAEATSTAVLLTRVDPAAVRMLRKCLDADEPSNGVVAMLQLLAMSKYQGHGQEIHERHPVIVLTFLASSDTNVTDGLEQYLLQSRRPNRRAMRIFERMLMNGNPACISCTHLIDPSDVWSILSIVSDCDGPPEAREFVDDVRKLHTTFLDLGWDHAAKLCVVWAILAIIYHDKVFRWTMTESEKCLVNEALSDGSFHMPSTADPAMDVHAINAEHKLRLTPDRIANDAGILTDTASDMEEGEDDDEDDDDDDEDDEDEDGDGDADEDEDKDDDKDKDAEEEKANAESDMEDVSESV